MRGGVDTGGHRFCSRVFGAVKIWGIMNGGWDPIFSVCDGYASH